MRTRGFLFPRRFFRIPFEFAIIFRILKYHRRFTTHLSTKPGRGEGHDLGENGLSFVSAYSLPMDIVLRVDFDLPGCGSQRIIGRVVRCIPTESGYLTAIQFLNLHGKRKECLRSYIINETRNNYKFLKSLYL